jgi:protein-disulfide isomerase
MKRYLPFVIIGVALLGAVISWMLLAKDTSSGNGSAASNSNSFYTYTPPPGAEPPHSVGPETAAATLEEYGDYQCPPCGSMFPEVKKIEKEYGDRIRFIFRQNPLPTIHKNAIAAAHAAEAAGMQGRFWAMHDKLYENQQAWSTSADPRSIFIDYARSIGLDVDRFTSDMASTEVDNRLVEDFKRGAAMGVSGTPTFFVNGREVKGREARTGVTPEDIKKALDAALAQPR